MLTHYKVKQPKTTSSMNTAKNNHSYIPETGMPLRREL